MFVGHIACAFLAKGINTTIPLWLLILASEFIDIIFVGFVLIGIEDAVVIKGKLKFLIWKIITFEFRLHEIK